MKMEDIAKGLCVSRVTVSRVINDHKNVSQKTKERVLKYIRETGYQPNLAARTLSRKKSNIIGIVCSHAHTIMVSQILTTALSRIGSKSKQALMLHTDNEYTEKAALMSIMRRTVDGLIIFSNFCDNDFLGQITKEHKNMVFNGPGPKDSLSVRTDHSLGMKQIMTYLFKLNHKDIHYLGAPKEMNVTGHDERQKGYLENMQSFGFKPSTSFANGVDSKSGYVLAKNLLLGHTQRPTAIVCYNDELAFGVMRATLELGFKIPDQLSITGYDGIDILSYAKPSLTTYKLDPRGIGKALIDTLLVQMDSDDNISKINWIDGEFIIGESTGPAI